MTDTGFYAGRTVGNVEHPMPPESPEPPVVAAARELVAVLAPKAARTNAEQTAYDAALDLLTRAFKDAK